LIRTDLGELLVVDYIALIAQEASDCAGWA